jgi:ATP-binding cassette subfamily B multidrug efflux pump
MRDLYRYLLPYCRRYWIVLSIGTVCVIIQNYLSVRVIELVGKSVDYIFHPDGSLGGFVWRISYIVLLAIVSALTLYYQRICIIGTSRKIEYEIRNDFFAHLCTLSPGYYDRMKTGDVISRATNDIDQVRTVLGPGIMYPIGAVVLIPFTLFAMWKSSPTVTLVSIAPVIFVPMITGLLSNLTYKRSLRVQEHYSDFSGRIHESIAGMRVVKSYAQSGHELKTLEKGNVKNARLNLRLALVQAAFDPVLLLLFVFGTLVTIWSASAYVTTDAKLIATDPRYLTKGELIAFVMLYRNLFWPILRFGWVLNIIQRASASMRRIRLIWDEKPEIRDNEETDRSLREIAGAIEFRNLTFQYPKTETPVLVDLSFAIPQGRILGIVGAVGSGKSTIAQIISRLYDPPAGKVYIDGRDIRSYPLLTLRRSVAQVFQETYLFSDTLAANIGFSQTGSPDSDSVLRSARIAAVDGEILELPDKFQTILGERGINLSGGQRQRVALARALDCDAPILILDCSFASVDTHTEEKILGELRKVMHERTTILISHRISTVQLADEILVLDEGRIAERGTHDALVALGGMYADIHNRQLLEEQINEEPA